MKLKAIKCGQENYQASSRASERGIFCSVEIEEAKISHLPVYSPKQPNFKTSTRKIFLSCLLHPIFRQFQDLNFSSNTTNHLGCIKMLSRGFWHYPFNFVLQKCISSDKIFLLFRWSLCTESSWEGLPVKVEEYKSALTYIMFHGEMKCSFGNRFDIWDFPLLER